MESAVARGARMAFRDALGGTLPARYRSHWLETLTAYSRPVLHSGAHVLDVGAGREPTIPAASRPPACHYVALDVSASEIGRTESGAYSDAIVGDAVEHMPTLQGRFDLIVSSNVFEHIGSQGTALKNLHSYLREGGRLVAYFSGRYSAFAMLNRLIPHEVGVWGMERLLKRPPDTVFEAYYDGCYYSALQRSLDLFRDCEIFPYYWGAGYFGFSRVAQALYLGYEEWAFRKSHPNLATHYLVCAER